jgi:hypothetical protein
MDLGGSAQAKQSGRRWPVVVLTLVVVVATIAGVWLASSAGLAGGTSAKPAADRSYDAIEAQRGAVTLSSDRSQALTDHLNGILDRAHATPYAGEVVRLPLSATSGTFHAGTEGDQHMAQAKRDRVGGP